MRELVGLAGTTSAALAESGYWSRLRARPRFWPRLPHGTRLQATLDTIEERHGAELLTFGGWHGDWGHWNMGMAKGVLQVWDWERYDPAGPGRLRRPALRRPERPAGRA